MSPEAASFAFSGRGPAPRSSQESQNESTCASPIHERAVGDFEEHRYGDFIYRVRAVGTIRLVAYQGECDDIDIPSEIEGIPVTALATNLLKGRSEVRSVRMPDTIEFTGHHVFDGCVNLRVVRLSAALDQVGVTIFAHCTALERVAVMSPHVKFENNSFADCPVAHLEFGPAVASVEPQPFNLPCLDSISVDTENGCFTTDGKALYSRDGTCLYRLVVSAPAFEIPDGCTAVEERAFDSLAGLRQVTLPPSLQHIGRLAFAKTGISSLRVPASVRHIAEKAFYRCVDLAAVVFENGLERIGEEAFAFTGVQRVVFPASLEALGFQAFEGTPAQAHISQGTMKAAAGSRYMDIDPTGGLYCHDVFAELIGHVERYRVRGGTHRIGDGAFKRHPTVRAVEIPEGVYAIGREAFKSNRRLVRVDLPESLERIGERAFLDTSLTTLRLSKNVREIQDGALLVQGENQLSPKAPLRSVDLDADNPWFYVESGLLCQRNTSKSGGDICLLYVGPDAVVRIPDQVTQIAELAFCGTDRVDELFVHDHLHGICLGAFSTARSIPCVHVRFPHPIDGYSSGDFLVPSLSIRYKSPSYLLGANAFGTYFDFEYYDSWVTHAVDIAEFAPAALNRLAHPMRLSARSHELYEGVFARKGTQVCRYFASHGNLGALETLLDMQLLDWTDVESELKMSTREGRTQATACLLELKHRMQPGSGIDFSL